MIALDTNVIVRYIVQDDKEQADLVTTVIEALVPESPAFISAIVLCEVNWVLKTSYKISKDDCIAIIDMILSIPVFDIEHIECCLRALKLYKTGQADFSDYLIKEIAHSKGYITTLTFDKKALKDKGFQKP